MFNNPKPNYNHKHFARNLQMNSQLDNIMLLLQLNFYRDVSFWLRRLYIIKLKYSQVAKNKNTFKPILSIIPISFLKPSKTVENYNSK